ncbi:MAG: glycosyltransferase family 9 protein [Deltaproteobacteria bacterium]|nr:MAG: glycosyltransferase family 9 protein [Deltaproteobacteria bacterium]
MKRLVVARTSALGDVLLCTPALAALKEAQPEAHLTFVTSAPFAALFEGLPFLDAVVPWDLHRDRSRGGIRRLAARVLRPGPVDLYIDLQNKVRTRLLGHRLRPARRLVYQRRSTGQALLALVGYDPPRTHPHATRAYLEVLAPLGVRPPPAGALRPTVHLEEAARAAARVRCPEAGAIAVAPGARHATKRWPVSHFAEVARTLCDRTGAPLLAVGGPQDGPLLDAFAAAVARPVVDTRDLDLPVVAALLERARLLVSNDTGPAHLAAAVDTPVVAVFGPTAESRWAPFGAQVVRTEIACAPCTNHGGARCPRGHHRCLRALAPDEVLAAALPLLEAAA